MIYYSHPATGEVFAYQTEADREKWGAAELVQMTPEQVSAHVQSPPPAPDPKLVGVEFEGVMCSATAADQAGLAAVLLAIQLQGAAFQPTRFYFENGNTLVITLANWQVFAATWLPFRQSFFAVT